MGQQHSLLPEASDSENLRALPGQAEKYSESDTVRANHHNFSASLVVDTFNVAPLAPQGLYFVVASVHHRVVVEGLWVSAGQEELFTCKNEL